MVLLNSSFLEFKFVLAEGASTRSAAGEEAAVGTACCGLGSGGAGEKCVQSCVTGVPEARAEHPRGVRRRQHGLQADRERGGNAEAQGLLTVNGWGRQDRGWRQ